MSEVLHTQPLGKPIKAHGEEVTSLELTRPGVKDVRELGYPFLTTPDGDIKLDAGTAARYISRLAKIPMGSVDQLDPADFMQLHGVVAGFFGVSTSSG